MNAKTGSQARAQARTCARRPAAAPTRPPHARCGHGVKDPVCGMSVDPHTAKHRAEHGGRTYYFCAAGCRTKFLADPARYLSPAEAEAKPVAPDAIYTCPMHPEIRQVGPGSCPICGMALEPVDPTADHGPSFELIDMQRRFWIGAGADAAGLRARDGRASPRALAPGRARALELDPARARHARRAVGRLAVLRARLAVGPDAQPQHVHADRARHRRRVGLQRRRHAAARRLPAGVPRARRLGRGLLRGRRRDHRARAARPGAGARGARVDRRRHPRAARPRAQDRAPHRRRRQRARGARSTRSPSATGCACARARRSPSTARSSRAAAPSTSPWSPASPCPSPRSPATPSSAAR